MITNMPVEPNTPVADPHPKPSLRISFILSSLWLSGGVLLVIECANHLARRGHTIYLIVPGGTVDPEIANLLQPGVHLIESAVHLSKQRSTRNLFGLIFGLIKAAPHSDVLVATHTPTVVPTLLAARLLRIKAQMLLPRGEGLETWEDPRAELVRRLLEYQQMREVVDVLERRGEERRHRFARSFIAPAAELALGNIPLALSLPELLAAVDRVLRTANEPTLHEVIPRSLDVTGAMQTVRALLALRRTATWSDLIGRDAEPWQMLSLLLAILEMAKLGELRVSQSKPFASVEIRRDVVSEAA